jgi:hypothetical protein
MEVPMKMTFIALAMSLFPLSHAEADFFGASGLFQATREAVPPGITLRRIALLTTDRDSEVTYLSVMSDKGGDMNGLYASNAAPIFAPLEGEARNVFWLNEIESGAGAVLAVIKGKKALILNGKLNRETQEGRFAIRYLANGLFGRYKSCEFNLRKSGNGWFIQNAYTGQTVRNVHVVTHSLGITTLEGLCPAE